MWPGGLSGMSDDSRALAENIQYDEQAGPEAAEVISIAPPAIPDYLQDTYWWAYLHPKSFWFFEREWVVNLILWGNMQRLTESVLDEMDPRARRALEQLCVARDAIAKRRDRPPFKILGNGHLLELARSRPRSMSESLTWFVLAPVPGRVPL